MFDLLKKRISGFVEKLSGKEGKKEEEPGEALRVEKEKPVSDGEVVSGQPPESEDAPSKTSEVEVEEEPPKDKAKAPKAAKPKKAQPGKKKGKPAAAEAAQKEEIAKAPILEKEGKETPKREGPKEEVAEAPAQKETPKKEKVGETPPKEPAKKKVREKPKEPEKKKGFLESVFGGLKKEEIPAPQKTKTPGIAKREGPGEKREVPKAPMKAEAKPEKEEEDAPAPPKAEVSKGKMQKKEEELKKKVKKSLLASVSETIRGESEVKEEEVIELLDELELGMLESDVALSVAEEIKEELRKRIIGSKVKRGQTAIFVRDSLKDILLGMFRETPGFEIAQRLGKDGGPHKIMVVGPNGAGKTTTIAKIVKLLQKQGHSVCVAASDTFRAAAVEQLVHHGGKLGVKVIHGAYGSDPTSIAFDALNHAKSNDIGIVIIDTAGRQDTNVNLINQLKKMDRVIKPELKIYVGESIAGNAMVEQISTFNNDIGLDGVVLTKLDCDPKGGTVISVSRVARLPILYVGTGQGYGDLKKFKAEEIVEEILS